MKTTGSKSAFACLAMGLAIASGAQAAPLSVPNTFAPGTPAKAAEVNANFSAVQSAVNANISEIDALKAQVDALAPSPSVAGKSLKLRRVADGQVFGQVHTVDKFSPLTVQLITEGGYVVVLSEGPADIYPSGPYSVLFSPVNFAATDCAGEAFASTNYSVDLLLRGNIGIAMNTLWVVAPDATKLTGAEAASISVLSQLHFSLGCQNLTTPGQLNALSATYRATPNIPSQTGIPTTFDINDYKLTFD